MHSSLGAFIETLRKMRKITIAELTLEAHISTKTYCSSSGYREDYPQEGIP